MPYQRCALLDAEPGCDPRLTTLPEVEDDGLAAALVGLFGKLLEKRGVETGPPPRPEQGAAHLAVPLIGLDRVIGILFVRRENGTYDKLHLRLLSLVASQLAAYLTMLRSRGMELGHASELEDARKAARSAWRAKEELSGMVAQDMRTLLAAALAWVRVLGSPDSAPDERARAATVVERIFCVRDRLVDDLIDLALPGRKLRLELRPVEPAAPIAAAVEGLRALAKQRSIRVEAALDPSVGPVLADAGQLDAVLAVLLVNAFKLTPDGGRVEVRLEPGEAGARIQVINSGRGFLPEHLPHLFEDRDGREGPARRRRRELAIGLAMAKRLVELLGGSIRAESDGEKEGATLTVELVAEKTKALASP